MYINVPSRKYVCCYFYIQEVFHCFSNFKRRPKILVTELNTVLYCQTTPLKFEMEISPTNCNLTILEYFKFIWEDETYYIEVLFYFLESVITKHIIHSYRSHTDATCIKAKYCVVLLYSIYE